MSVLRAIRRTVLKPSPARLIVAGFLVLILAGALLLSLPVSSAGGGQTGFTDSLFTSVSAVCVTGLVVVDTNVHWSFFGKAIILLLIQAGALGIMSVATLFSVFTGARLGLIQRLAIQESLNRFSLKDIVSVFQKVMLITLIVEAAGAVVLSTALIPAYGWGDGLIRSLFLSVSAFCNAGFDPLGTAEAPFASVTAFAGNGVVLLTLAVLIVLGGLGFIVWNDVLTVRRVSRYSLHTKIVLITTAALLLLGAAGYFLLEGAHSMASMPPHIRALNAVFHSATARTAGFNSLDMGKMSDAGNLLTMLLMFVGGAPGSTAGGIKVTTLFVLALTVHGYLSGRRDLHALKRRIPPSVVSRSVSIFIVGLITVLASTALLLACGDGAFLEALFESVSAFGTVGLTLGITPGLSVAGKYAMMLSMFLGRIGTITILAAFALRQKGNGVQQYPDGQIAVG